MASLLNMSGGSLLRKGSLLPSGYKQLEYIENTSNAYIDTGIKPDANTDIETCFIIEPHQGYGTAFGVSDGNWDVNAFTVSTYVSGSYGYGNSGYKGHSSFDYRLYDSIIFRLNSYGFYVNDVMKGNNSTFQKTVQSYNLTFFVSQNGNRLNESGRFKCKWAKIKDNDTLVRNFIPCINPNNVVGMYDTVNGVFYSSPNGTAFIAGQEV